jgi:hypothetical protein
LRVGEVKLRTVFKISKNADHSFSATMDSLDQGARNIPVSAVSYSNRQVQMQMTSMKGSFTGEMNANGSQIAGTFQQLGRSLPLTLNRTATPASVALLPASAYAPRTGSDLQGYWKGRLLAGQAELRVAVKISDPGNGSLAAAFDSIDQGANNIPVSAIDYTKPTLNFDVEGVGGHYEGYLNKEGTEISGNWMQRGRRLALVLIKSKPSEVESKPPAQAYASTKESDLQGFWSGALNANGTDLHLVLKLAKASDGTFSGTLDSLDQGLKDLPVTTVSYTNSDLVLEWKGLRATYRGTLENGKLTGTWEQGPGAFQLDFARMNQPGQEKKQSK